MAKRRKTKARKRASPAKKSAAMSMPASKGMTCTPSSSKKCWAWVILVLGLLLLLRDFGWNFLGNIEAWTLVFLVVGAWKVSCAMCK